MEKTLKQKNVKIKTQFPFFFIQYKYAILQSKKSENTIILKTKLEKILNPFYTK